MTTTQLDTVEKVRQALTDALATTAPALSVMGEAVRRNELSALLARIPEPSQLARLGAEASARADTIGYGYSTQAGGMPTRREMNQRIIAAVKGGDLESAAATALLAQILPLSPPEEEAPSTGPLDFQRVATTMLRAMGYTVLGPGERSPFAPTLDDLDDLQTAFGCITRREFRAVLRATIGASHDYADGCLSSFQSNPIGYCRSRSSKEQGDGLFNLALEKIRRARETGRVIGCPGEGRCHEGGSTCESCGPTALVCHHVETCEHHKPVTDTEIEAALLDHFTPRPGSTQRERATRDSLVTRLDHCFGRRFGYASPRAEVILEGLLASGKLGPAVRPDGQPWPPGWLQAPLPPLRPGEHSSQCPVTVEYWRDAEHNPDVCSWTPPTEIEEAEGSE